MQVTIGQKSGQAQRSASRCIWDVKTDGAASECFENESMFCVCQVWPATAVLTAMHALHSSCPGNALAQWSGQSPLSGARALGKNEAGIRVFQVVSCTAVVGAFTLLVRWQMTWNPLVRLQVYGLYFL